MSDGDRQHDACGADVAAYALGALSAEEVVAFEAHLATCTVCSAELASFQLVTDAMALTAEPRSVPSHLRRQVMRTVRQEAEEAAGSRRQIRRTGFARSTSARPWAAAAAALAAAAIAVGVVEITGSGPPTRIYQGQVSGRGSAEMQLSGTRGVLAVHNFAAPPKGHAYEVWLVRRGTKTPVPAKLLFNVSSAGDARAAVPVSLHRGDEILVNVEPAGYAGTKPTTAAFVSVKLA